MVQKFKANSPKLCLHCKLFPFRKALLRVCVVNPSPSLQMLLREWGGPAVSGCLWKVDLIRVPGKPASLPPSPFSSLVWDLKEAQLVSDQALREEGTV